MFQKKKLHSLYDDKVKNLVNKLLVLNGETERYVELLLYFTLVVEMQIQVYPTLLEHNCVNMIPPF